MKYIKTSLLYFLNENHNSSIFYHNSNTLFKEFKPQKTDDRLIRNYIFFSNEKTAIMYSKYIYTVKLTFNSAQIFNSFEFIKDFELEYSVGKYTKEIKKMFRENLDYFYDEWIKSKVDSPSEVEEYFIEKGGDANDKVELLFYFLTKWNDSWVILETDIFLRFIESKGYVGFVTVEEGSLNIALKNNFTAHILNTQ